MKHVITVLMLSLALGGSARAEQAGGLTWTAPPEWKSQGERPMRGATYSIPAAKGNSEPAELAVFYFGQSSGGGADSNVKRCGSVCYESVCPTAAAVFRRCRSAVIP